MASERDHPALYGQVPQASPGLMETHQFQRPSPARNDSFDSLMVSPMDDENQHNANNPSSSSITVNDATLTQTQQTQTEKLLERAPRSSPSTLRVWWPEMLTCVFILGMFGAIVGTIHPYQGKPLPIWPYHLQINTVVSIYFTIIKACMVFILAEGLGALKWGWFSSGQTRPLYHLAAYDNATRGPWGSLNLLWKLRCRTFLPSIAALAIVLATIVDPFGQQIIRFYPCQVPATGANGDNIAATVTRNRFVDGGFPGGGLSATDMDTFFGWTLSGEMQDAVLSGIYNSPKSTDPDYEAALLNAIKPFCPTGNCTFSVPYVSAGWCSECSDLTSQVKVVDVPKTNIVISYAGGGWNDTLPAHKNATLVYHVQFPSSDPPYPEPDSSDSSSGGGGGGSFGPTFGKRQGQSDFGPTFGGGGGGGGSGGGSSSGGSSSSDDTPPDNFGPTFGSDDNNNNNNNGGGSSSSINDTPSSPSPTSTAPEVDPNSTNDTPNISPSEISDSIDSLTTVRLSAALTDPPVLQFAAMSSLPQSYSPSVQIILLLGSDGPRDAGPSTPAYYTPDAFLRNKYSAATCSLSPCVRRYNATVTNGLMREEILAQSSDWGSAPRQTYQSSCWSILDIPCLNSTEKSSLRKLNYTFSDDSDSFLKYHYSGWTYPDIPKPDDNFLFSPNTYHESLPFLPSNSLREECIYQVCTPTFNAIQMGLDRIFNNQWAGYNPWVSTSSTSGNYVDGPPHLQSIYQNGNVSLKSLEKIFESVANRMTLVNRRAGRQYVQTEKGEVLGQDTCVDVRWLWILYPGVLAFVTVGFLVGAILTGRCWAEGGAGAAAAGASVMRQGYKNGVLPLVLYGVERKDSPRAGSGQENGVPVGGTASAVDITTVESGTMGVVERVGEIEELSKKMHVRLDRTEGGWRFKEV